MANFSFSCLVPDLATVGEINNRKSFTSKKNHFIKQQKSFHWVHKRNLWKVLTLFREKKIYKTSLKASREKHFVIIFSPYQRRFQNMIRMETNWHTWLTDKNSFPRENCNIAFPIFYDTYFFTIFCFLNELFSKLFHLENQKSWKIIILLKQWNN